MNAECETVLELIEDLNAWMDTSVPDRSRNEMRESRGGKVSGSIRDGIGQQLQRDATPNPVHLHG